MHGMSHRWDRKGQHYQILLDPSQLLPKCDDSWHTFSAEKFENGEHGSLLSKVKTSLIRSRLTCFPCCYAHEHQSWWTLISDICINFLFVAFTFPLCQSQEGCTNNYIYFPASVIIVAKTPSPVALAPSYISDDDSAIVAALWARG